MKCLIIDDNDIAQATMVQLAQQVEGLEVAGVCGDALEAYKLLRQQKADLLLLDIEMPGMTGLELIRQLGPDRPLIVFTTARPEYAVEAFDLNVVDYLVKPVGMARFLLAVERARQLFESRQEEVEVRDESFVFIRDSNEIKRFALDELLYAEAMGDYVKLHTRNRFIAIHATLKALEGRLPPLRFQRVHRSYMVAIDKIETIREGAIIINGKPIPVADAYRAALNRRMNVI